MSQEHIKSGHSLGLRSRVRYSSTGIMADKTLQVSEEIRPSKSRSESFEMVRIAVLHQMNRKVTKASKCRNLGNGTTVGVRGVPISLPGRNI
jgi:hypothetical protein